MNVKKAMSGGGPSSTRVLVGSSQGCGDVCRAAGPTGGDASCHHIHLTPHGDELGADHGTAPRTLDLNLESTRTLGELRS